eukprot:6073062-Pyramimonas_sp.AAC.1
MRIEDVGAHSVNVRWMPSHMSEAAAQRRGYEPHWFRGNQEADSWAKTGAKAHPANHHLRD